MMATTERQVRISKIAGRYLVFDIEDVVYIRRQHGICSVFTGTMPQNPTQNIFLGLPVELYAEEARLLVDKGAGYIADDPADHLSQLKTLDETARKAYIQSLKSQRRTAQQVFLEAKAQSHAKHLSKRKPSSGAKLGKERKAANNESIVEEGADGGADAAESLFGVTKPSPPPAAAVGTVVVTKDTTTIPAITPTTSSVLIAPTKRNVPPEDPASYPLYAYLNARGYFITPGLRFGGDYSVYPGDPFRFHAHYLANSYGWDEKTLMLDLLTSGRLGTAVKKSFLFGAQNNNKKTNIEAEDGISNGTKKKNNDDDVRIFCIEWAGM
ncbi:hypothetical protein B0H63DRAFT_124943 [Podospora didyma]|uniref:tRNA-splicing endonuclease subunit Sen34 n=1 Tax=Podospora didyma TaxID=330526 RepID=A0AAE0P096_9PEZI|nr:hypothetical protein B0H63DRAFT_124943 [Podospora didyma]